jgi:hypothetical protein
VFGALGSFCVRAASTSRVLLGRSCVLGFCVVSGAAGTSRHVSRRSMFGGPVKVARVVTQQAAQLHWGSIGEGWRGGGRVMGNLFCGWYMGRRRGQEYVSELESERWIGLARAVLLPLMSSARSTAPWPCCWLWWFALACATQRINRLSKHLTRPNLFLDDSTSASAGLQLCRASARDAHRRPPSAGIRQHEETGNSRACKLPISAGFFFLLLSR